MKFKKIAMVILQVITGFTVFSQAPREWWFGDAQRANDHYLNKFLQKNLSQWSTSRQRIDGFCFRRDTGVGYNKERGESSSLYKAFKKVQQSENWSGGMNSGCMNKSWIKSKSLVSSQRKEDLQVLKSLVADGTREVVMFLQSPLSKGDISTFKDGPDGASMKTRIKDCLDYIAYMENNKTRGSKIKYAVIDALPAKATFKDPKYQITDRDGYRDVYRQFAHALRNAGYHLYGIMFDWPTNFLDKSTVKILCEECEWVATTLSKEIGYDIHGGWWAWSNKKLGGKNVHKIYIETLKLVATEPLNRFMTSIHVSGNTDKGWVHLPDTIDGPPYSRLETFNEAYEIINSTSGK